MSNLWQVLKIARYILPDFSEPIKYFENDQLVNINFAQVYNKSTRTGWWYWMAQFTFGNKTEIRYFSPCHGCFLLRDRFRNFYPKNHLPHEDLVCSCKTETICNNEACEWNILDECVEKMRKKMVLPPSSSF